MADVTFRVNQYTGEREATNVPDNSVGMLALQDDVENLINSKADASVVSALSVEVDGKAAAAHTHEITEIPNLRSELDGKAQTVHAHAIANVEGLQTALDGKSAVGHEHAIGDITGLQTALNEKTGLAHGHTIAQITNLQATLDGKASTDLATYTTAGLLSGYDKQLIDNFNDGSVASVNGRTGIVTLDKTDVGLANVDNTSDVNKPISSATQTALDGKAATAHTHAIADVTNLQTSLDAKVGEIATRDDITARMDSGFYESNTPTIAEGWPVEAPTSWWHLLSNTHSNSTNYYSMQFAAAFHTPGQLYFRVTAGSGTAAWYKMWHAGNDGAGSALDADLFDGYDSAAFPRLSVENNWTNHQLLYLAQPILGFYDTSGTVDQRRYRLRAEGSVFKLVAVADGDAIVRNLWTATHAGVVNVPGSLTVASSTAWHAGNDGAGSTLDADLFDGYDSAAFPRLSEANVFTNGQFFRRAAPRLYLDRTSGSTDSYAGFGIYDAGTYQSGKELWYDYSQGRWEIGTNLIWHSGNDGAGSTLDSDLLDGYQAAAFALLAGATFTGNLNANNGNIVSLAPAASNAHFWLRDDAGGNQAVLYWQRSDDAVYLRRYATDGSAAEGYVKISASSLDFNANKIWHAGNDGAGTGLDADLFDGYDSAAFPRLAAANWFTQPQTVELAVSGTTAHLDLRPTDGALSRQTKIRMGGTFGSGTDLGDRLVAEWRAGFDGGQWGTEYLDLFINSAANDTRDSANMHHVLRFQRDKAAVFLGRTRALYHEVTHDGGYFYLGTSTLTSSGVPRLNLDNGDYLQYDRTNNEFEFYVGDSMRAYIGATDLITYNQFQTRDGASDHYVLLSPDGAIELFRAGGPYIDFKDAAADDFDVRLQTVGKRLDIIAHGNVDGSVYLKGCGAYSDTDNDGTWTTGTYTPTPTGGNLKQIINGGAFTLATPAVATTLVIEITNNATAGAITFSGYTLVDGDTLTTTDTHKFLVYITRIGTSYYATVKALQ